MLDSFVQPAWVHRVLRDVARGPASRLALVILNEAGPEAPPGGGLLARLRARRSLLAYAVYRRLDARLFGAAGDPLAPADAAPLLEGVPVVRVAPRMTKNCDYFPDEAVEEILSHRLDVVLRMGFRILKGRALEVASHGVWSFHHGDNRVNRGGPAGFWEVLEGWPLTGSVLQVISEELDGGRVIYRSWSSTDPRSVTRNLRGYYWKSSAFVARALAALHAGRDPAEAAPASAPAWEPYSGRLFRAPTNAEMLRLGGRLVSRFVGERARGLVRVPQWRLAYRFAPQGTGGGVPHDVMHRYRPLVPPADRFWADPFPALHEGRYWVFFEELVYREGKGHIAAVEMTRDGPAGAPVRVLERPYHLSYPFVFEWDGAWWMIPETQANRTVELYRCASFPGRWELHSVLLADVSAVDATLHSDGDRWWMFVNVAEEHASTWDELHLYHAPSPLGPWTPHPRSPVKSDPRGARPAGRLFSWAGALFRPGQDCSGDYGRAIVVHRVDRLDEREYAETEVARLDPAWAPRLTGVHTLNAAGDLSVIDVRVERRRFRRGG